MLLECRRGVKVCYSQARCVVDDVRCVQCVSSRPLRSSCVRRRLSISGTTRSSVESDPERSTLSFITDQTESSRPRGASCVCHFTPLLFIIINNELII